MLSVVVVSFNTRQLTLQCLSHLYADLRDLSAEVLVVDNGSEDGSVDAIRLAFPHVRVIENQRNVGFGAANNQAMRLATGRFLLLLNSDAFAGMGTCRLLIDYLERNPRVGVVGPRLLNADETLQPSCYPFPSPARAWVENLGISRLFEGRPPLGDFRNWPHDQERIVPWVVGACILLRREVLERVGGFDERFFMYAEETDWQRRIRTAGWDVAFVPAATTTHLGGSSGAGALRRINDVFFESLDKYQYKHHGIFGMVSVRFAMTLGSVARLAFWAFVYVFVFRKRQDAAGKMQLHQWLIRRQTMTYPAAKRHCVVSSQT